MPYKTTMAYENLKSNPLTYALGKGVMSTIRFVRTVQNILQRHRLPALLPIQKRALLLEIGKMYNLNVFFETGTLYGDTVAYMAPHFKRVVSYELAPDLHKANVKKLNKLKNIELHLGDSGKLMPQHLKALNEPAMFWLDGHFSGGATAHGDLACPVEQELHGILSHPVKGHVIAIDDARDFLGLDGYPTIGQLQRFVNRYPGYMLRLNSDIFIIAPSE
ncbi:MAG: hypothetical protein WAX89_07665 [Alphaproteobacteria bacterium]